MLIKWREEKFIQEKAMKEIRQINPSQAADLISQLDDFNQALYPPEGNHLDSIETLQQDNVLFLGCFYNQHLAAIGAVKIFRDYGEIKRIFVSPEYRGHGLAKLIMAELEKTLKESGIRWARLETGPKSVEAVSLYKNLGYVERKAFGSYQDDPIHSVFMEKDLS